MSSKRTITRPTTARKSNPPKLATARGIDPALELARDRAAQVFNNRSMAAELSALAARAVLVAEAHRDGKLTAEALVQSTHLDRAAVGCITRCLEDDANSLEEAQAGDDARTVRA